MLKSSESVILARRAGSRRAGPYCGCRITRTNVVTDSVLTSSHAEPAGQLTRAGAARRRDLAKIPAERKLLQVV